MGRIGEKLNIDFVISTGDNFYENGLKGVDDSTFEESFTNIYTAKSQQKQWYSSKSNKQKSLINIMYCLICYINILNYCTLINVVVYLL